MRRPVDLYCVDLGVKTCAYFFIALRPTREQLFDQSTQHNPIL